jgi:Tfp pilus assembly protein PilO
MAAIRTGAASARRFPTPQQLSARLLWEVRRIWRQLGWGAALGIVCLLLALAVLWQTQNLLRHKQELARQLRVATADAVAKPSVEAVPTEDADIARQLSAFYAYLPQHEEIPDQLKRLITLAQKADVTLAKAEYKAQPEANAAFMRYQIILPVTAEYRNLQTFIQGAFQELPTLMLESIAFKREKIESGIVEARIQYQLLVKKAVPKGAAR